MEGTERAQPVHVCLNMIVNESCVIWTLSEIILFTLVLTGLFIGFVARFGHGRD